jgi:exodeoxyribonuclease-5
MSDDPPTAEQAEAEDLIDAFLDDPNPPKQWFCLQGLAGTGKSWVLSRIARRRPDSTFVAPFGRTASMLTRRTGIPCMTIHSAIYYFMGESEDAQGNTELDFELKIKPQRWKRRKALVDESGVIDEFLARDLLSTGARIVATGDPGQLPPVKGKRFFTQADFTLQQVQRQAWNSPIIRQAHNVRHTGQYQADGDDFRVERFVGREDILAADIFLCWTNATRRQMNRLKRAHIGIANAPPLKGEPIMCLKNNHEFGVMNGALYELIEDINPRERVITVRNDRGSIVEIEGTWFEDVYNAADKDDIGFAYAYASTADKTIIVDEYNMREWRREWLYTGITRASKSTIVQRS